MVFMATILYIGVRMIVLVISHNTFANVFFHEKDVNALQGTNEVSSDGVCMSSIIGNSDDVIDDENQSSCNDHDDRACDRVDDINWIEPEFSETNLSDEEIIESNSSESSETDEASSIESDLSETQLRDIPEGRHECL
jgi:hypothetical protein